MIPEDEGRADGFTEIPDGCRSRTMVEMHQFKCFSQSTVAQ